MKNFKLIGKGHSSNVYKVEDEDGKKFALKVVKSGDLNFTELDILSRLKSPYLVRSVDDRSVIESNLGNGITMELKNSSLKNLNTETIPPGQIKRIISCLLNGIKCMHEKGFLHLDIKLDNVVYDNIGGVYTAYITDFGMSMRCNDSYKGIVREFRLGALKYSSYELLEDSKRFIYSDKSDVWSLGISILMLLGFKYQIDFSKYRSRREKRQKVREFWSSLNILDTITETVKNNKFSEIDKIDLYELLSNMIVLDPKKRISSKDFDKLRFFNSNVLENKCYLSKPKEILYIPYSSTAVIEGINNLRTYFQNVGNFDLEIYFLSIEIFIRMMAYSSMEISNENLQKKIQISFLVSMKYYKKIDDIPKESKELLKNNSYIVAKYLNGDIAPNTYYYKAKFIEDLILVDQIVLKNYNLICFYSYMDPDALFSYFRQNYNYLKKEKDSVKKCKEFFNLEHPEKNSDNEIENNRDIFSYTDVKSDQKEEGDFVSEIDRIQTVERKFREIFLDAIKSGIDYKDETVKQKIQSVLDCDDIVFKYNKYFAEKSKNIFKLTGEISNELQYGYIEQDMYGQLQIEGNLKSNHIIFKNDNEVSLLVKIPEKLSVIHYYSKYNEELDDLFSKYDYEYKNNYELKTPSICKINEICILFLIFFNDIEKEDRYNILYLEDKTLKTVLMYAMFKEYF